MEHIGPVQFNLGGITVDAEEMVRSLKAKGAQEPTPEQYGHATPENLKKQNEELAQFFAGLMERGKKGSPRAGRERGEREGTPGRSKMGESGAGGGVG